MRNISVRSVSRHFLSNRGWRLWRGRSCRLHMLRDNGSDFSETVERILDLEWGDLNLDE